MLTNPNGAVVRTRAYSVGPIVEYMAGVYQYFAYAEIREFDETTGRIVRRYEYFASEPCTLQVAPKSEIH